MNLIRFDPLTTDEAIYLNEVIRDEDRVECDLLGDGLAQELKNCVGLGTFKLGKAWGIWHARHGLLGTIGFTIGGIKDEPTLWCLSAKFPRDALRELFRRTPELLLKVFNETGDPEANYMENWIHEKNVAGIHWLERSGCFRVMRHLVMTTKGEAFFYFRTKTLHEIKEQARRKLKCACQ